MSAFKDVVVLLPGITGSVLSDAKGKALWGTSMGAVWRAVTSLGDSIRGLELDGDDGIVATGLIPDVMVVPGFMKIHGYSGIEKYLIRQFGLWRGKNYFPFPYDWRLDNRKNAKSLEAQALHWLAQWRLESGNSEARLVLVAHSMGGLVARYFLECLGGYRHTRSLVTIGTPHQGSLNALNLIENGMKKGIGPFGIDLTPLLRSYPAVYQLLPLYSSVEVNGELKKVADAAKDEELPHTDAAMAADARIFHREIENAQKQNAADEDYTQNGYILAPVVGIEQATFQSAVVADGHVTMLNSLRGTDSGGDGTVPRLAATPIELENKGREIYAGDMHGALQNDASTRVNVTGVITRPAQSLARHRGFRDVAETALRLELDDVVLPGEPLSMRAMPKEGNSRLKVELTRVGGAEKYEELLARGAEGWQEGRFRLPPGTWQVQLTGAEATASANSVNDLAVVVTG